MLEGIIAFVLGTAIGSFCNAVIYRLHVGDSPWRGRSYCPHCKHPLAIVDLVPLLSFLVLHGRCRYCQQPIAGQYFWVELAMGLLALGMVWRFGISLEAVVGIVMSAFLLVIFVYDLRHQLILDRVSLPAMVVALVGSLVIGREPLSLLVGAIVGAGLFFLQFALSKGRWIGGGDIRLGAALGLMLGWPLVGVSLVLAYFSGAIVALGMILTKRKSWTSAVPFGTFLSAGGVATFLWGNDILQWYLAGGFFDWVVQTFLRFYNPTI